MDAEKVFQKIQAEAEKGRTVVLSAEETNVLFLKVKNLELLAADALRLAHETAIQNDVRDSRSA